MYKGNLAPIVFFVYNRLEHSVKTIDALKQNPEAKESILYIFSDGPKEDATDEQRDIIQSVRDYIHTITGFKKVIIEEAPKNKGLAKSTIDGISKVVNAHGKVIVIEDDDAPSPYFLAYENECLNKFEDDERYWMVSGYVDNKVVEPFEQEDVYAVCRNSSWGFGTWARCWNKVIWDIDEIKRRFNYKTLTKFAYAGGFDLPVIMVGLFYGYNNSWSVRFEFSRYMNNGLTIFPSYSLIKNIGLDGSGTHCSTVDDNEVTYMSRKVIVPSEIKFDEKRNKQLKSSFTPRNVWGILFKLGIFFEPRTFLLMHGCYEPLKRLFKKPNRK